MATAKRVALITGGAKGGRQIARLRVPMIAETREPFL